MREWLPVLVPIWLIACGLIAYPLLAYPDERAAFIDWLVRLLQ